MTFENHPLTPPLDQHIESIFHFKNFIPDHTIERVVPTGHLFLIFELDGFTRNTFDNKTLQPNGTFTKAWVSGMHRHYFSISAHEKSEMLVVQFKATGAFPFFHNPIQEITEKVLPAELLVGKKILQLRDQLITATSSKEKFLLIENWLNEKFDPNRIAPTALVETVSRLQQTPADNYMEAIAPYPHSQKHLIDQFKKYVGLTPKYYQRILRFNEIFQKMQQQEKISWAQIAYQCGYADQSHFIKEFKHFSGFNPQKFLQQPFDKEDTNFFPLDREG